MLRKLRTRIKGQSTAEYAILIALVIGAVVAMQTFARRALQARIRDAAVYMVTEDDLGGNTLQYEPYYADSAYVVNRAQAQITTATNTTSSISAGANITRESQGYRQESYNNEGGSVGNGYIYTP